MQKPFVYRVDDDRWAVVWPAFGFAPKPDVLVYSTRDEALSAATGRTMAGNGGGSFSLAPACRLYSEGDRWDLR